MELEDGAYPNLLSVEPCVAELEKAFTGCDVAVLVGGKGCSNTTSRSGQKMTTGEALDAIAAKCVREFCSIR